MRRTMMMIGAALCLALAIGPAFAQDDEACVSPVSAKVDLAYVSKYIWRGLALNPDPAFQPAITLSHISGLSLNVWGSMDTTDIGEQIGYGDASGSFTEIDYTLNYAWASGPLSFNAGAIAYTFPNTDFDSTTEVYGSVCFGGSFSPAVSVNYDVDLVDGFYASLSTSYACNVYPARETAPTLNFGARLSFASANYNKFYFGVDKTAVNDLLLSASVPLQITPKFSITPALYYSMIIDSELRDAVSRPDNFVAGITASYAF